MDPDDLDAWCRAYEDAVAKGADPFTALVDADHEHRPLGG